MFYEPSTTTSSDTITTGRVAARTVRMHFHASLNPNPGRGHAHKIGQFFKFGFFGL